MQRILRGSALVGLLLSSSACGTVLSTMQPAQTTPGHHVRGEIGLGVSIPAGQIADTLDAAENIATETGEGSIPAGEIQRFLEGVAGLFLNPPSVATEFQARYGFSDIVDVGLRLATSGAIRLDLRYRMINPERPDGFYGSTGLGVTYASFGFSIPDPVDRFVELDAISRVELDMPMLFGWSDDIYHVWFGPKLVLSSVTTALHFRPDGTEASEETVDVGGVNFYYVAQIAGAIGYKHVWIALELTIGGIAGGAEIKRTSTMEVFEPGYSGLMLYPAIGLLLQF